jgi:hypothetical protein
VDRGRVVWVGFEDRLVKVCVDEPAVFDGVRHAFREMVVEEPAGVVARIGVEQDAGGYLVRRGGVTTAAGVPAHDVVRRITHEVAACMVESCPGRLWLHAGAAAWGGRALLVVGAAGSGKSTTVARLVERGWGYLSDELVAVDAGACTVAPFPVMPTVRRDDGRDLRPGQLTELYKVAVEVHAGSVCREPVAIGGIVFPRFDRRVPVSLVPCPAAVAALELLASCLNFASDRPGVLRAVGLLVARVPAKRLVFGSGDSTDALARALEGAQGE